MTTPWDLIYGASNTKGKADYATKLQAYAEAYDKLRKEHGSVWLKYRNIQKPEGYDDWKRNGNRYIQIQSSGGSGGSFEGIPILPPTTPVIGPTSADAAALEANMRNVRNAINQNLERKNNISQAGGSDDAPRSNTRNIPREVITGLSGRRSNIGQTIDGRLSVSGTVVRELMLRLLASSRMGSMISSSAQKAAFKNQFANGGISMRNKILSIFNELGISFAYDKSIEGNRRGEAMN